MTTFVDFQPTTVAPFQFQPTLANGLQYIVTVPWNEFGQRFFVVMTDLAGTLVVSRGLAATGPTLLGSLTWTDQVASVITQLPHNVPVASVVNFRIAQSNSAFDGTWQGLAVGATGLTYSLPTDPSESAPISGQVNFDLDLLNGYGIGPLYYHEDTQQFEF